MDVTVTRGQIRVNGTTYTVFTGFLTARNIAEYSRVPSFAEDKSNYDIARDLLTTPVEDWQRPADSVKVGKISTLYSSTGHDNIMPNGVLLGIDKDACDRENNAPVCLTTPMKKDCGEENAEEMDNVDGVYNLRLEVGGGDGVKPLLILDGQHRIAGLNASTQADQPVAFVLCKDGFSPNKMAEIFTHVTTEATPMKKLHKNWMQYAFGLGDYSSDTRKKAGETVVRLCTEEGTFRNKIRFNDYSILSADRVRGGFNQDPLYFDGWSKIISDHYFSQLAPAQWPRPRDLARAITTGIDALREVTTNKDDSVLFRAKHHSIICEEFLKQFMKYLSGCDANPRDRLSKSKDEWKRFFKDGQRQWHNADWSLPYVLSIGQNADDLKISRTIAKNCFRAFFQAPADLMGTRLQQYLRGIQGWVKIRAYKKKADGSKDYANNVWERDVTASGIITINDDGIDRDFVHVESYSANWVVKRARDPDIADKPIIDGILVKKRRAIDIRSKYPGVTSKKIMLPVHSYHSSSKKEIEITINW